MTKIDIVSGFLGAGKTTLIRKLLADALKGQQVVLIENEFGEIGIDGGFLKDAGIRIREMNSGCICCSLVGDFGTELKEVIDRWHPDRVIIEPSGVGKLSDVIHAVEKNVFGHDMTLNSATTVIDVTKCRIYNKNFGEFFKNQIEAAGTIVLSRMDTPKATPEKVEEAMKIIRELNPSAVVITTPVETLSGQKLLDTIEGAIIDLSRVEEEHEHHHDHDHEEHEHHHDHDHEEHEHHHDHDHEEHEHHHDHDHEEHEHHHDHDHEEHEHHHHHDHEGHHHHHHDADEIFTSWGVETVRKYSKEELAGILEKLSDTEACGMVLRAKGMVESTDGTWMYFDMVPEETEIRSGEPEFTGRLCVIGSELKEDYLKELFGV